MRGFFSLTFILGLSLAFTAEAYVLTDEHAFSGTPGSEYPETQFVLAGDTRTETGKYSKAVGRIGGCSGTLASPPNAEVSVVVFAAHCGSGSTFWTPNGTRIEGFQCYVNRDFPPRGSADDDVGVCFSKRRADTGFFGCLDTQPKKSIQAGDQLRILGYGNPVFNAEPMETLQSGVTTVRRIQHGNKAIIASGGAIVTPGDSGGPVVDVSDERAGWPGNHFRFVGVNSKYIGGRFPGSAFAPFSPENVDFFNRAIAAYQRAENETPKICGINWQPGGSRPEDEAPAPEEPRQSDPPPAKEPPRMPSMPKVEPQAPRTPLGNRPTLRQRGYIAVDGVPVPPGAIDYRWLGPGRVQWIFPSRDDSHGGDMAPAPQRPAPQRPAPRGPLTLRQRGLVAVDGVPVPDGAIDYRWLGRGRVQWIFPREGNGGDRQPSSEAPAPSGDRQKITDRLWRIGGTIHERRGNGFQPLFGRSDGIPGGSLGPLGEEGQKDLAKVYCDQGFSEYQGQRLINALAFLYRRRNELSPGCLENVVRPALARVGMGRNSLVDGLRAHVDRPSLPLPPQRKAEPETPEQTEEKSDPPAPREEAPGKSAGGSHIDYASLKPAERAAIDTCVRCHQNRSSVGADFKTAQGILDHFGEKSWEKIETMFTRPGADFQPGARDLVKALHDRARGAEQPGRQIASTEARRCSLMDQSVESRYLGVLPEGPPGSVLEGLRKVAIPYTTDQMPRARQSNPPNAAYTIPLADSAVIPRFSMGYPDRSGFEFPWRHPGGMLDGKGSFKFFVPPASGPMADIFKASKQTRVKLDGRWQSLYGQSTNLYGRVTAWTFRPGTVFGEVFTTNAPDGTTFPTETRIREMGADGKWRYRVYRPFTNAADLAATIRKEFPNWEKDEALTKFVGALEDPNQAKLKRPSNYLSPLALRLNSQASTALQPEAPVQVLPALPGDVVRKLLDRPFREVTGPWNTKDGKSAWAPQSDADFGLFPRQAKLAPFLPSTTEGCTKCHDSTLVHLDRLNPDPGVVPGENGSVRDWYGHDMGSLPQPVAGSNGGAGIRSWHPWSPSSLTPRNGSERQARFNPTLWQCGLLNVTDEIR